MSQHKFSRFTFKEDSTNSFIGIYHTPVPWPFDIICDLCKVVVYRNFNPADGCLRLNRCPVEDQIGCNFYSIVEGDQSIEYCKKCIKIIQVAPL